MPGFAGQLIIIRVCINTTKMRWLKLCQSLLLNSISQRSTIRLSSHYRRSPLGMKSNQLADIKQIYFNNRTELSPHEWQEVTDVLLEKYKHINKNNIDAVIVGVCNDSHQLTLANSFLRFLQTNGRTPNDATLGKLLRIYNGVYHARGGSDDSLTQQEQNEVLQIYEKIRSKHDVLDSMSCENLIYGLVGTSKWKDGLQLIDMMRVSAVPSQPALTELTVKAFRMKDMSLGWKLLEEMLDLRKQPKCEILLEYLNIITTNKNKTNFIVDLERMLRFFQDCDVVITKTVAKALTDIAEIHPLLLTASVAKLKRFGKCSSCHKFLENVSLSDELFEKLRSSFLEKVLVRKDVFQRSTPDEVHRFRAYIEETGPFDCVIDGLNVAYSAGSKKPPQALANLLANVVKYFTSKKKNVLVLGRQHMNKWPQKPMRFIKDNAALFLANDLSQDDPFLLYATLMSGQTTDFFSRDLMRQHAFLLGPELKTIFRRWQQEHQYSLVTQTDSGKIVVKEPIRHLICAHKVGNSWHVPFKNEYSPHMNDNFDVPEHWLCITLDQN